MLNDNNFGVILKKIRKNNGDSLRKAEDKTGIHFSYIDRIEKGIKPVGKIHIEDLIKAYPQNAKELAQAYVKEVVPSEVINILNNNKNDEIELSKGEYDYNTIGDLIKKIRLKNGDSLRSLGEKTDVFFTYIDKIEKNQSPLNKNMLEKLMKIYPLEKEILLNAYVNEVVPTEYIDIIKNNKETNNYNDIYNNIFKNLDVNSQKTILNIMLDKYKLILLEKDLYKSNTMIIDQIKEKIDNLD